MRYSASVCIAILMMVIAGCSHTNSTTRLPLSDFTVGIMLQGNWLVEAMMDPQDWTTLGVLTMDGNSYHFRLASADTEIPSWMRNRFCFFDQPAGQVVFEYEPGVSPDNDVRTFAENAVLLNASGIGCSETFLIRVDQDSQELYLHSQFSEMQLYRIYKSYDH